MKKIIVGLALVTVCFAATAQVKVYRLESVGENAAYTVPGYIRTYFESAYPSVTYVVWEPTEDLWRASYLDNNRITHIYYNSGGDDYRTSLPVLNTYVPEEVVKDAIERYGTALYSITRMKGMDGTDLYQVGLLDNTMQGSVLINEEGVEMSEVKKWKIEKDGDMKIKTETEKIKMKMENE
jgi:hypothetical protein